ncbi:MAG: DUF952 domain-containing protein [Chloroflexota bacterium]
MDITFHGTPAAHFDSLDPGQAYVPANFEREGFIHCTDGERRLADTLTAYYGDQPDDWLVLYIDRARVKAQIKYEDPERVFPHIYGPPNRDAIVAVRPIIRTNDGAFLAPRRHVL